MYTEIINDILPDGRTIDVYTDQLGEFFFISINNKEEYCLVADGDGGNWMEVNKGRTEAAKTLGKFLDKKLRVELNFDGII